MIIDILRVLIDFGLVVLIWLVQLVIYPSFRFYDNNDLFRWHKVYKNQLALVVMPLMLGQLSIYIYLVFSKISLLSIIGLSIAMSLWLLTFFIFVPLHNEISSQDFSEETLKKLIKQNWLRTGLWSILFVCSLANLLKLI